MNTAAKFITAFQHLRQDAIPGRWPATTMHVAPHKPLLLISVLDNFLDSPTAPNLIEPALALEARFQAYWDRIMVPPHRSTMALPFFHLKNDGFWSLIPVRGMENALAAPIEPTQSMAVIRRVVKGAILDPDLYALLQQLGWCHHLRSVLIASHFAAELHEHLVTL